MILFIPGDQFLSAALAERPALLDDALRQNIILATPTSLVALLKAVAYGWQQTALAQNAAEIRTSALQLYERLTTFASHLGNVGKSLGDSVRAFNASVGSLERMVLPSARRFTDLGVQPRQRLVPPKSIEELTRDVAGVDDSDPTPAPPTGRTDVHDGCCRERRLARATARRPPTSTDRVIMVTGATSGIGRAVARALVASGATVILHGRNEKALEALYQELKPLGPEPSVAQIDLERAQGPQYQQLTSEIESRYGRLDGLLHNAAILGDRSPIEHYDIGLWQRVLLVDLTAPFILTRCLLPLLRNSADASIVFTTSSVGRRGRAYWGAYSVAKGRHREPRRSSRPTSSRTRRSASTSSTRAARARRCARARIPARDPASVPPPESVVPAYLYLLGGASRGGPRPALRPATEPTAA